MTPILGILLALFCALATNVGFLYKHRGVCEAPPVDMRHPLRTARSLFRSRLFAIGMAIAVFAWLFHVGALSLAPMSLVQSVLAGGMVLLAVMAERMFGLKIGRRQWLGLAATAVGLIMLGVTLPVHGADSRYSLPGMIAFEAALIAGGTLLIMGPRIGAPREHHGYMLGAAAGILLGVSDVGIKAISGMVTGGQGLMGFVTPWFAVALAAAIGAFYASAKSLQEGEPVPVIAITGTTANLGGIVGGIIVFGDPLAGNPASLAVQCMAFALVLLAAWLMPAPVRAARGSLGGASPASA